MADKDIKYALVPLTRAECDLILRLIATAHDDGYLSDSIDVRIVASIEESIEKQEFNWVHTNNEEQ